MTFLTLFVTTFVLNMTGKRLPRHHETFRVGGQQLWAHAINFTRWQHHASGCGVSFAVPSWPTCSYCYQPSSALSPSSSLLSLMKWLETAVFCCLMNCLLMLQHQCDWPCVLCYTFSRTLEKAFWEDTDGGNAAVRCCWFDGCGLDPESDLRPLHTASASHRSVAMLAAC